MFALLECALLQRLSQPCIVAEESSQMQGQLLRALEAKTVHTLLDEFGPGFKFSPTHDW